MKKLFILFFIIVSIIFVVINWEWISELRNENISYFTDELFSEYRYAILLVTIPLIVLQNVFTLFPIILLIVVHFISFGVVLGFIFSFIGTTIGALLCFWLSRTLSGQWVDRFWNKREEKLTKILHLISSYGVFTITVLRSIPVLPSNLISVAAAISPINKLAYFWSTVLGNISMIWLLSLLSSPLWMNDNNYLIYFIGYLIFVATIVGYYFIKFYRKQLRLKSYC